MAEAILVKGGYSESNTKTLLFENKIVILHCNYRIIGVYLSVDMSNLSYLPLKFNTTVSYGFRELTKRF